MIIDESVLMPEIVKVGIFVFGAFALAMILTPIFTYFAFKHQWWRKKREHDVTGKKAEVFSKLHHEKHQRNIPTMAGSIILVSVAAITFFFNLDRSETWLPLFALAVFGAFGLADDLSNVFGKANKSGGMKAKTQVVFLLLLATLGALWFHYKLGWNTLHIPAYGDVNIGWLYIPLFVLVVFSTAKAVSITDGLDGLSGGLLAWAFGAFAVIAYFQDYIQLSEFCAAIVGATLAYTWFNIFPARFFMGQVGSTSLGATLGVVAMLTNSVLVLPIIGFVFVMEAGSSAIQLFSKKFFGRKIFISAPVHHHFEAKGWPETKVTMRFWIIGGVMSVIGMIIGLLGRG